MEESLPLARPPVTLPGTYWVVKSSRDRLGLQKEDEDYSNTEIAGDLAILLVQTNSVPWLCQSCYAYVPGVWDVRTSSI